MSHDTVALVAEGPSEYIERGERMHDQFLEEDKCSKALHIWSTPVVQL